MKSRHSFGDTWAMEPNALKALFAQMAQAGYDEYDADDYEDVEALYRVEDGVAILEVHGSLVAKSSWMTMLFGMTAYTDLVTELQEIKDNPEITSLVLDIDSPGGEVAGIQEVVFAIKGLGKPVTASVNGMAASAAYWIASAADSIEAVPTALIGCLGTMMSTYSDSDEDGIIRFTSSLTPNKNPDPAGKAGKEQYQQIVDDLSDIFLNDVADNRGLASAEEVAEKYGAGATVVAIRALKMGLIDVIVEPGVDNADQAGYTEPVLNANSRSPDMADQETPVKVDAEAVEPAVIDAPVIEPEAAVIVPEEVVVVDAALKAKNDLLITEKTDLTAMLAEANTALAAVKAQMADMKAAADAQAEDQRVAERESILLAAQASGKIAPADIAEWRADYDENPILTTRAITRIKRGATVPVATVGLDSGIQEAPEDSLEQRDASVAKRAATICAETGVSWAVAVDQAKKEIN